MTRRGIAKGRTIELEEPLPFPEGQRLNIFVEPAPDIGERGSSALILRAVHEPPHLEWDDIAALEQAIAQGRLPVRSEGPFDDGPA